MRLASHYNFTFVTHPYFKCKSTTLTLINMQLLLRIRTGNSPSSRFGEVGPQAGLTVNIPGRRQQPQCLPPFIMHHLLHVLLIYISQLCDFFLVVLVFTLQCISCAIRFSILEVGTGCFKLKEEKNIYLPAIPCLMIKRDRNTTR